MKVGAGLGKMISQLVGDSETARINMRAQQVRERYRAAIETVYRSDTAKLHLAHTNKVIIKNEKVVAANGEAQLIRMLIVYVDDPLFAAELNAQRELIKLNLLERFGEEIEDFVIRVSGRRSYREEHPFIEDSEESPRDFRQDIPLVSLNADEESLIGSTARLIEDEKLRKSLEKAMTADLKWKKGENVESERKNTK